MPLHTNRDHLLEVLEPVYIQHTYEHLCTLGSIAILSGQTLVDNRNQPLE